MPTTLSTIAHMALGFDDVPNHRPELSDAIRASVAAGNRKPADTARWEVYHARSGRRIGRMSLKTLRRKYYHETQTSFTRKGQRQ